MALLTTMAKQKRKPRAKRKSKKPLSILNFILFFMLIVSLATIGAGVYLYKSGKIVYVQKKEVKKKIKDKDLFAKLEKTLRQKREDLAKDLPKEKNQPKHQKPKDKHMPTIEDAIDGISEAQDYDQNSKDEAKEQTRVHEPYKGKPKLAIIIDDVSFAHQTKRIKQIPYKVTPAFFPPTKRHPNSAKIARDFSVYMVHLPLEAQNHKNPEQRTLKTGESYESINRWVKRVKKWFPKAKYFNGHTGSKFTSDLTSMDRLFRVLRANGLTFIDSRTSAKTKAGIVAKKYSTKLLSRDVFLDNSRNINDIKKQLKKAVQVAKEHGFAIAICHPYQSTLKVLKNAKPLLRGVSMVYVHEL